MRTFTAQFRMPGNIGVSGMDPDSVQSQQQLSTALMRLFTSGKAQLTHVNEFNDVLDDHEGEQDQAESTTFVDINLYLNETEGVHFISHKDAITQKAVETLRNSKMFLSYLWHGKNTEHIGLETIFV